MEHIGPEPLALEGVMAAPLWSPQVLAKALAGRRTPLKSALLDQRIVAGLGNIYVCEALHRAGLHRVAGATPCAWCRPTHGAPRSLVGGLLRGVDGSDSSRGSTLPISVVLRGTSATSRTSSGYTIAKDNRVQGEVVVSVARRFSGLFSPVVRPSFVQPVSVEPAHLGSGFCASQRREVGHHPT